MKFKLLLLMLVFSLCCPAMAWEMKQGPLMTRWASQIDVNNPFPDYPKPQMVRAEWLNLNGIWQFQSGSEGDAAPIGQNLSDEILVPFAMESAISGVMEHHERAWYRRTFEVPAGWSDKNIILHLDAVDWESEIFVNGNSAAVHQGGYDPIILDITPYLTASGPQELIVRVYDATDYLGVPRGKQTLYPGGIMYTSVSGIWQSVWLEPVAPAGIENIRMVPDIDTATLNLRVNSYSDAGNLTTNIIVKSEGQEVTSISGNANTDLTISIPDQRLWSPDDPFLYDLEITLLEDGSPIDYIESYFGMRKSSLGIDDDGIIKMFLNNEFVFQMGPLDQGWWPDGLYTAPTEEALKYDIEMTKAYGFNMTRKHIKVEPARWYYWCDKIGIMVWQDMPSSNSYTGNPQPIQEAQFELELDRMMDNLWNVPSIISWVVFNESQGQHNTEYYVNKVKAKDPSRLVNQASGGSHYGVGDILDYHSYPPPNYPVSDTMARACGEYGGIGYIIDGHLWNPDLATGIYSNTNNAMEQMNRYDEYIDMLLNFKVNYGLSAAVYTEITDVENEVNGLMTYDRTIKQNVQTIANSNTKAITGDIEISVIVPNSSDNRQRWSYTTNEPSGNWYETDFDVSSWSSGYAGFGGDNPPNANIRTTWNTADIWLRREFELGSLSPAEVELLVLDMYHDEDCEVYINGVLASERTGYVTNYTPIQISSEAKSALILNGTNTIAIHCHQTTGGQYIDAGLSTVKVLVNAPFVPEDYIGWWQLEETSGTTAADIAGNNNGTVSGASWSSSGKIGSCISFDGIDDYVEIERQIADNFSISFWAKTSQTAAGSEQWWQGNGIIDADIPFQADDFGITLFNNTFAFGVGNQDKTIVGSTVVNDGAWHHCTATRNSESGLISLYIDGVLQAQDYANTAALTSSATIKFGTMNPIEHFYEGQLDEVKIYDRELGDKEIMALFANTNSAPEAPTDIDAYDASQSVTIVWADTFAASSYNIKRATTSGGPYTTIANVTDNSYIDNSLDFDTRYYYVVTALNPAGESSNSDEVSTITVRLKVHYDASSLAGMTDGARVSSWEDLTGNGFDATQASYQHCPYFKQTAANGHPAVFFSNSAETFMELARPVANDFSIVIVFQSNGGISTSTNFYDGAGLINGEKSGVTTDYGMAINANGRVIAGTGSPDVSAYSEPGYADSQPHIATFIREQATGQLSLYVDGVYAGGATGSTAPLTAPSRLTIGSQQTEINYLNANIFEILIYNVAIDSTERTELEEKLKRTYIDGYPGQATIISPEHNQVNVSVNTVLQWNAGSGAQTHKVRLGYSLPISEAAEISTTEFQPDTLEYNKTYYWTVEEVNGTGTTLNDSYWRFTTAIAGDLELDGDVDMADLALLLSGWLDSCSESNSWCDNLDIDTSTRVDMGDIQAIAENWMVKAN